MDRKHITNRRMREINLSMVLSLLRRNESMTRSQLAAQTGLTAASITNLINDLHSRGYVEFVGIGESIGGRKPEVLRLCADAEYAIGLEMTATRINCVLGNLQARILARCMLPIRVSEGREAILDRMISAVEQVIAAAGLSRKRVSGVGLAIPGPCDYKNGVMLNPPNYPDWAQFPIRDVLSERLGMRAYICKETSCDALAEYWFGGAQEGERILALHIDGVGVGGAFVDQGSAFLSDLRETMDIGHNTVQADGYPCACGNRGCLEAQACGRAAVRYTREFIIADRSGRFADPDQICFDDVLQGVAEGDIACLHAVERCADYLSIALRNAVLLLAPDRIFCGGAFVERCPWLLQAMKARLNEMRYPDCTQLPVETFSFGENNGAVGALALVFGRALRD